MASAHRAGGTQSGVRGLGPGPAEQSWGASQGCSLCIHLLVTFLKLQTTAQWLVWKADKWTVEHWALGREDAVKPRPLRSLKEVPATAQA